MAELLVGSVGEHEFAIQSDRVIETLPVTSVSRFMRTGRADVVAAVVHDTVRFLSDPAIRLGLSSADHEAQTALIISARAQITGLLFSSSPQKINVEEADLLPVAPTLSAAPYSACFRHGGAYIGVLSESFLSSMQEADQQTVSLALSPETGDPPGQPEFLLLTVAGEEIAVEASRLTEIPRLLTDLVPLALAESAVLGLVPFEGQMVPAVDLSRALQRPGEHAGSEGVVWSTKTGPVALAVQQVAPHPVSDGDLSAVPRLVHSPAVTTALVRENRVTPIVALEKLFSQTGSQARSVYYPTSDCAGRVGAEDLPVVEIAYRGFIYAVPESEVSDTVPAPSVLRLAIDHPLVDNLAQIEHELIPVLNLQRYLGHPDRVVAASEALLITNGDFRAAVAPESVVGKRIVQVKSQRPLPVEIPFGVLYGCYVDGPDVRLILNLAAIAQHARDAAIQTALATFSRRLDDTPEQRTTGRTENAATTATPSADELPSANEPQPAVSPVDKNREAGEAETATDGEVEVVEAGVGEAGAEDSPEDAPEDVAEDVAVESTTEPVQAHASAEEAIDTGAFPAIEDKDADLPLAAQEGHRVETEQPTERVWAPRAEGLSQPEPSNRRRSWGWLLVALPLLLIVAVGGVYLFAPSLFQRSAEPATVGDQTVADPPEREAPVEGATTESATTESAGKTEDRTAAESMPGAATAPFLTQQLPAATERVYFQADSWDLLPDGRETLERLASSIKDPSLWRVEIVGHAARAGTAAGAQWLSEQRAQVVRDFFLSQLSESPDALSVGAAGASDPAASNATDEGMARNRRVVVTVKPVEN